MNELLLPGILSLVLILSCGLTAGEELSTRDGLRINLDPLGRVTRLETKGFPLYAKPEPRPLFLLQDYLHDLLVPVTLPTKAAGRGISIEGKLEDKLLSFHASLLASSDKIEISGEVTDERRKEDRAVDVIIHLPFQPESDTIWWQDIRTRLSVISAKEEIEEVLGVPCTVMSFPEFTTKKLRIHQGRGGGCPQRPDLLWLAEVEVFGRDQTTNLLRAVPDVKVDVSSSHKNYSPGRIIDGQRNNEWNPNYVERGWASGEEKEPKWVEFDFGKEVDIARVDIYWCRERFGFATSEEYCVEKWDGEKWTIVEPTEIAAQAMPGDAEKTGFETKAPALETEIYPLGCLTDAAHNVGLAIAIPPDAPCRFKVAYNDAAQALELTFKFGLSQLPREAGLKGRAPFRAVVYAVDPSWGFRDAVRRYYSFFPEAFVKRAERDGLWLLGSPLDVPNAYDYAFHEHGQRTWEIDKAYDIYTFPYILVGQREFHSEAKNYEEAIGDLSALSSDQRSFYGPGLKEIIENCSLRKVDGKYIIRLRRRGGSLTGPKVVTFPVNPDPNLFEDEKKLTAASESLNYVEQILTAYPVDGIYVDSLSSWGGYLNYRREHFPYVSIPLSNDDNGNVIIDNHLAHVEFLRELTNRLHPRNKMVFGNGIRRRRAWCAFLCDVCGVECGPSVYKDASHYRFFRTVAYHKPFLLLYYYNYPKLDLPREAAEEYIQSAIAYGIAPEVRPFGKFIERDLDLYEKFMPVFRLICRAGWEPVTYAEVSDSHLWLERFGGGSAGLFFTVYNPEAKAVSAKVTIDVDSLGLAGDVEVVEIVEGQECSKGSEIQLSIPKKSLRVLQVGKAPPPVPVRRIDRALVVEHILKMRESAQKGNLLTNGDFEEPSPRERPIGWSARSDGNADIKLTEETAHSGKKSVYIRDDDPKGWVDCSRVFQYIQADHTYYLGAWAKQTSRSKDTGRLYYQWRADSRKLSQGRFDFPRSEEWKYTEWELKPPEGATQLSFAIGSNRPEMAEFYVDDVQLTRMPVDR